MITQLHKWKLDCEGIHYSPEALQEAAWIGKRILYEVEKGRESDQCNYSSQNLLCLHAGMYAK